MKKGLLSLLVVALTVVGCQDYDDQFDSLNKEISALKTDLTTIKGLTTSVAAISTEIKALEGKMVTDSDITGILTQIAAVKAAVAAIDVSGIDDVKTQTADLNQEIIDITAMLTKIQAASGGTYAGNLKITNAVQLTAAEDIVDSSAEGPKMTITGNVEIDADNTGTKEAANILRIQAILDKLKVVSGNVTITGVDAPMTAGELLYVTGSLHVEGSSTMGLSKLNTVDGSVELNLYGDLSYPLLGSAGSITLSGAVASITTVDLSGLTAGIVSTEADKLILTKATSVKVGSLPASVTLAKAVTVEAHGTASLEELAISAPAATAVTILAEKFGGSLGIINIDAPLSTMNLSAKTISATVISAADLTMGALTTVLSATTLSVTTMSLPVLKTVSGSISQGGGLTAPYVTSVALPALESLTATATFAEATSFIAPKLTTTALSSIDIKSAANAGGSISVKSIGAIGHIADAATIGEITVALQANDLVFDTFVQLKTLNYTGKLVTGTVTVSAAMVSMTTLTLGSTSKLLTLTVSATNMVTLSTAGVILNTAIGENTKLSTLSFGHTHLDGELATTVEIFDNDKLVSLDMSSLGKVKAVEITGNASLTTFVAPSFANKAEPQVTIMVTMTGNDITGTYSATIAATETTPVVPYIASSAAITSWKGFIDGYSSTNTVTFALDIDRVDNGSDSDGKFNNGAFSAAAPNHGSVIDTAAELAKF